MSSQFPPPPPSQFAQPPGPPASTPTTLDFSRAFTFIFQDPDWVKKTLIGGLFYVLSFVLIGAFIVFGYLAQLVRNVIAGKQHPLPEWDNIGGYLVEGLKLFLVGLVWYLPFIFVLILAIIPLAMFENTEAEGPAAALFSCGIGLVVVMAMVVAILVPAAMVLAMARQRASAAFEFRTVFSFIRANAMNYVLVIVVYLVTNMLSQFGIVLLCIGVFWTVFLSLAMTAWALGETYRLSPVK